MMETITEEDKTEIDCFLMSPKSHHACLGLLISRKLYDGNITIILSFHIRLYKMEISPTLYTP